MTATVLRGVNGSSPLGFLASLGLLRLVHARAASARLGFLADGSFHAFMVGVDHQDLSSVVASDAAGAAGSQPWRLEYTKIEKKGPKLVADLKAPPAEFSAFMTKSLDAWAKREDEGAAYAAAFGTDVAVDGKGNTKPTAFHFTAANQQVLDAVEKSRAAVTDEWVKVALFEGDAARPGPNLRWDPGAERNWALMASNPIDQGTVVSAPLEWLAFRALPIFPCFPRGSRVATTSVRGRGDEMRMQWPLWSVGASLPTVRSLVHLRWDVPPRERALRGVFAVCSSAIRRTSQGFGNFGPAVVDA